MLCNSCKDEGASEEDSVLDASQVQYKVVSSFQLLIIFMEILVLCMKFECELSVSIEGKTEHLDSSGLKI